MDGASATVVGLEHRLAPDRLPVELGERVADVGRPPGSAVRLLRLLQEQDVEPVQEAGGPLHLERGLHRRDQLHELRPADSGAFTSNDVARTINGTGAAAGPLTVGGAAKPAKLVSIFCIPPTFNPLVDAAADLPGPGAVSLQGNETLD
jgi:hypothetical protein